MSQPGFTGYDPLLRHQMERLHRITVYARWIAVAGLWASIAPFCLWDLRPEIALWRSYFTWTALRYGLAYHRLATFGLALCIGSTVGVLIWQSRNILIGVPPAQVQRLEEQVLMIRRSGKRHPLWKWVCQPHPW